MNMRLISSGIQVQAALLADFVAIFFPTEITALCMKEYTQVKDHILADFVTKCLLQKLIAYNMKKYTHKEYNIYRLE